jgi:hypothetical protein
MAVRTDREICSEFNTTVRLLIDRLTRKSRRDEEIANLERLKSRISVLKSTLGDDAVLAEAKPCLIEFSDRIMEDNVETRDNFFLTADVRAEYTARGLVVAPEDEFVFTLIDSIRAHYKAAGVAERNDVCREVNVLLKCALEHANNHGETH